jgi:hypothetical protein
MCRQELAAAQHELCNTSKDAQQPASQNSRHLQLGQPRVLITLDKHADGTGRCS